MPKPTPSPNPQGNEASDSSRLPVKFEIVDGPSSPSEPYYGGPQFDPEEEEGGVLEYWRILRRRKGTLILGATAGLLLGIAVTLPQTPIYQASTTLEIQSYNQNFMNMQSVQQTMENSGWDGLLDIQTQIKILQSATLIERVQARMKREQPGESPADAESAGHDRISTWRRALNLPDVPKDDARQHGLAMAAGSVKVRASGQTRIVEVVVDSTEPQVAAEFANLLTSEYVDQSMEARWESTQRTGEWLTKQLDDMRIKLERSEDALHGYAQRNNLMFTGNDSNVDEVKLRQIQDQLTVVQGDRVAKQSRWEMASSAPADSLPDILNDSSMRSYQEKLADLRRDMEGLLETFTPETQRVKKVGAQIASLEKSFMKEREQILRRIRNEHEEAVRKELLLQLDYDKQSRRVTVQSEKAIQYSIIKREVETNRQLYDSMLQRVKEAGLAGALTASNVRIVDPAKVPQSPYKPRLPLNALLGLLAGGFLAVAFVVTTEKADRALREPSDVPFYLGVKELGVVPSASLLEKKKGRKGYGVDSQSLILTNVGLGEKLELVTVQRRLSSLAESFRAALTSIMFSGNGSGPPRMIVVTSPNPSEGKTTVATNLAVAMAETGQKVLLIDGDTRRPRIHTVFEIENAAGLSDLLKPETADWKQLIHTTSVPNLRVLTAGPGVAAASNMLFSKRLLSALEAFRQEFDMVVIDTPPMLQIPDARLFGKLADGIVLVVRANSTTRDAAIACRLRLREDGTNLTGTIMNDWDPKDSPGGYYGYYGKYSSYHQYSRNREES